jgi:thiamine biosynthesis lipoprotein
MMANDGALPERATQGVTRRRVMSLVAACGLPLVLGDQSGAAGRRSMFHRWRSRALGAPTQITLAHPDAAVVKAVIQRCLSEIIRLESVFSLYQADSEISRLNRDGRLADASLDFRLLLAESLRLGQLTGGAFDISVQPLWTLYETHFAAAGGGGPGPSERAIDAARRRVDFRQIDLTGGGAGFLRPKMAVTLNGIAQGYITDRIATILRDHGFDQVLADFGEIAALDPPQGQSGWTVRIDDPGGRLQGDDTIVLNNRAIATSSGSATRFDDAGRYHHLFDPRTGRSAVGYHAVSVISRRATLSDALSTALSILPQDSARPLLRALGAERAIFQEHAKPPVFVTA